MPMELRGEWTELTELFEKVKELRGQGYTALQIEEETGFDYEGILWALHTVELIQVMREAK